jgi:N-formylglutamate amidohydrolase
MRVTPSVKRVYDLDKPEDDFSVPFVCDSPHSGTDFPESFDYRCDKDDLMRYADLFVEELYAHVPSQGGTLLTALFPRTFIDVNRSRDDIDLKLLDGIWEGPIDKKGRADVGHGVIYRRGHDGSDIYGMRLPPATIRQRLEEYYDPYHGALNTRLEELVTRFGQVWHINCHSMPSKQSFQNLPDFVIGDRNGTSCEQGFTHFITHFLMKRGYRVGINNPYKGAEILKKYGRPQVGFHSLQLEINRALYMDEKKLVKKPAAFEKLRQDLQDLTGEIIAEIKSYDLAQAAD